MRSNTHWVLTPTKALFRRLQITAPTNGSVSLQCQPKHNACWSARNKTESQQRLSLELKFSFFFSPSYSAGRCETGVQIQNFTENQRPFTLFGKDLSCNGCQNWRHLQLPLFIYKSVRFDCLCKGIWGWITRTPFLLTSALIVSGAFKVNMKRFWVQRALWMTSVDRSRSSEFANFFFMAVHMTWKDSSRKWRPWRIACTPFLLS